MIILGVNFSNDAAAALVRDGEVVAAVAEERFSRRKHDRGFPRAAIDYCLREAGVAIDGIDAVAFFWNPGRHLETPSWKRSAVFGDHSEYLLSVANDLLPRFGAPVDHVDQRFALADGRRLRIVYVNHHTAHAAAAFFRSNFEDAAILTVDGYGERASTLVADGQGRTITPLLEVEFPHSVGSVYAAVTQYLGYRPNSGEGKVMGLADYGSDRFAERFAELIRPTDTGFEVDLGFFQYFVARPARVSPRFVERFGPPRAPESAPEQRHMDVAFALQAATEQVLVHLARIARERTGRRRLCMAGGVALNCVSNTRIVNEAGFEACYFHPAASDAGTSMGAALAVAHLIEDETRRIHPATDYLGPSYGEAEILAALERAGVPFSRPDDLPASLADVAARLVANGFILSWFQGRAEFGPRALGNRSIVADPRRPEMKDVLNARVKFREWYRPFAPSVLEDRCGDFFDSSTPSPYMLRVYFTRPEKREILPAVTHIDGSARVQTVRPDQNARYHALIAAFGRLTGVPVVLNTSFNVRGEPIVNDPGHALRCFFTTDMDFLVLGDYLLEKRPGLWKAALGGAHAEGFGPLPRFAGEGAYPERKNGGRR